MHPVGRRSFPEKLPPDYSWQAAASAQDPDTAEPMKRLRQQQADDDSGDDSGEDRVPTFSSRVLLAASVVSLAWLALAAAVIYLIVGTSGLALTLTEWAGVAGGVAAPLSAIWLIALVSARVWPGQQREMLARIEAAEERFARTANQTRTQLESIDSVLAAVTQRVEGLRSVFANEVEGFVTATDAAVERTRTLAGTLAEDRAAIDASSAALAASGEKARADFGALAGALPDAEAQVNRIAGVLETSAAKARAQLQETEDLLAAVWTRSEEAGVQAKAAAEGLTSVISAIAASAGDAESRLGAYSGALENSADAALAKTGEALEATRLGVEAQTAALAAAISRTSLDLDDIGGRAVETIAARITAISEHVGELSKRIAEQDAGSQSFLDTVQRGFSVLDAKLGNAANSSESVLAAFSARITQVRGEIDALSTPLGATRGAAKEIGEAVASVRAATEQALASLAEGVPAGAEKGLGAIDALRGAVANLSQDVDRLSERAAAINAPIAAGRRAIDELLDGLEDQRESLEVAVAKVRSELDAAQGIVSGIGQSAESTALSATTQLIDALGRVREVAAQTAGTVKTALENVVEEAREALSRASSEAVRQNAIEPVEAQIRALETASARGADAAQAAAERLSRQLVSVAETAAAIETRVTEADAHLDAALRTDIGRQSELLVEALNSASIDIAKGLSAEVTESAWKQYLAGERGVFSRRAVQLLSNRDAKEVARRYADDGEFRDAVRRYIHDFEAMLRRFNADRDGNALSMTLLSSDLGKLYVALAQATERLRS